MCIYGMEGPGGYQFVGRTVPIWDRWGTGKAQEFNKPWLLRFFDQIQYYPVSADELLDIRNEVTAGRYDFDIKDTVFSVSDYLSMLESDKDDIYRFESDRTAAFNAERMRWLDEGIDINPQEDTTNAPAPQARLLPSQRAISAPIPGVVWKLNAQKGQQMQIGESVVILESMKMETTVATEQPGTVVDILCAEGQQVQAGDPLVIIQI